MYVNTSACGDCTHIYACWTDCCRPECLVLSLFLRRAWTFYKRHMKASIYSENNCVHETHFACTLFSFHRVCLFHSIALSTSLSLSKGFRNKTCVCECMLLRPTSVRVCVTPSVRQYLCCCRASPPHGVANDRWIRATHKFMWQTRNTGMRMKCVFVLFSSDLDGHIYVYSIYVTIPTLTQAYSCTSHSQRRTQDPHLFTI